MLDSNDLRKCHEKLSAIKKLPELSKAQERQILELVNDDILIMRASAALYIENARNCLALFGGYFAADDLPTERKLVSLQPSQLFGEINRQPAMPIITLYSDGGTLAKYRVAPISGKLSRIG